MAEPKPLDPTLLCRSCDPQQFEFRTTAELAEVDLVIGQPRVQDSLKFAMGMEDEGYNVFALGSSGVGKLSTVRQLAGEDATRRPVPADWCYVNNFSDPAKPRALRVPAGRARVFQRDMEQLVEELGSAIPAGFEGEHYQSRVHELEEELKERQSSAIEGLRERAKPRRFALLETPGGFAFAPLDDRGEVLSPERFSKLPRAEQEQLEAAAKELQQELQKSLRQFPVWHKEMHARVKELNREIASFAVNHLIEALESSYHDLPHVLAYLGNVQQNIVEHVDQFLPRAELPIPMLGDGGRAGALERFKVNVIVDNAGEVGAPVVYEDLPNYSNLIGRAESRAHMGTLVSDFTLIKPGALHRASGGYLILEARKVLQQPFAWEALKRSLRSREIRIESLERSLSLVSTVSLEPEPIPLDLKVILLGDRLVYYLLCELDPEFIELFKVAADFEETMDRDREAHLRYPKVIATMARHEGLRALDPGGVARVIEQLARLAGDAEKLSTHLRSLSDLLHEADYWAGLEGRDVITRADVDRTVDQRIYRSDSIRARMYEQIRRGTVMIDTAGAVVGQVNGLSVIQLGEFSFGRPSRITATTRIGEGEVLDIERETELGGALHSKGVMILSSFLAARYTRDAPLSMTASLVFEQSYAMVEGDSASLAELCAILSSLSGLPIDQSLAVTGSVNQHGAVQPIGGVNEKVEGFFNVCAQRELTGTQGVVIPSANVKDLMLRDEVVEAARAGRFRVFAVARVDEAMALLTATPAGAPDESGTFPADSVNARVEQCLREFGIARSRFAARGANATGLAEPGEDRRE